ncbi:hypothetical protein EV363DRAFT_1400899 [Boletus edulis]|nr:hypothetical protein EV363DRAFT_1400899 [Boletus edulis]
MLFYKCSKAKSVRQRRSAGSPLFMLCILFNPFILSVRFFCRLAALKVIFICLDILRDPFVRGNGRHHCCDLGRRYSCNRLSHWNSTLLHDVLDDVLHKTLEKFVLRHVSEGIRETVLSRQHGICETKRRVSRMERILLHRRGIHRIRYVYCGYNVQCKLTLVSVFRSLMHLHLRTYIALS